MQSRALAIALLLALFALLATLVYVPWQRAHHHYDTAIEDQLDRTSTLSAHRFPAKGVEANIARISGECRPLLPQGQCACPGCGRGAANGASHHRSQ